MSLERLFIAAITIVALGACTEDGTGSHPTPAPSTYTLSATQQWSGGTVGLTSSTANAGRAPRLVLVGTDSVTATAATDTSYTFTLPPGPSATLLVRVPQSSGSGVDTAGTIDRVGLASTRTLDSVYWSLTGWRPGGAFAVLGYTMTGGAASADLETGVTTVYHGLMHPVDDFLYGAMGATNSPDVFVLRDSATLRSALWQLYPTPVRLGDAFDTHELGRQLNRVSDSTWIVTDHHFYTVTRVGGLGNHQSWLEGPYNIINSSNGKYSTFLAISGGVPLLDSHTGDSLAVLPMFLLEAAVFAANGTSLYLAGRRSLTDTSNTLLVYDLPSGSVADSVNVTRGDEPFAMVEDPMRHRIYLATQHPGLEGNLEVLVYTTEPLALAGRLTGDSVCTASCGYGDILLDSAQDRLFVVADHLGRSIVQRFALMP